MMAKHTLATIEIRPFQEGEETNWFQMTPAQQEFQNAPDDVKKFFQDKRQDARYQDPRCFLLALLACLFKTPEFS